MSAKDERAIAMVYRRCRVAELRREQSERNLAQALLREWRAGLAVSRRLEVALRAYLVAVEKDREANAIRVQLEG